MEYHSSLHLMIKVFKKMKAKDWMLGILVISILGFSIPVSRTVTGVVTDAENGSVLEGVKVESEKGEVHTVTDSNGKYSIRISSDEETLIFSKAGFKDLSTLVGSRSVINISVEDLNKVRSH